MKPVATLQHSVNHAPQEHTPAPPDFHWSHNAMDAPLEPMEMRSKVQILRLVRNAQKGGTDPLLALHKNPNARCAARDTSAAADRRTFAAPPVPTNRRMVRRMLRSVSTARREPTRVQRVWRLLHSAIIVLLVNLATSTGWYTTGTAHFVQRENTAAVETRVRHAQTAPTPMKLGKVLAKDALPEKLVVQED